mgnify:CR=1 FL=1
MIQKKSKLVNIIMKIYIPSRQNREHRKLGVVLLETMSLIGSLAVVYGSLVIAHGFFNSNQLV